MVKNDSKIEKSWRGVYKHTSLRSSWKVLELRPQVPWQLKSQTSCAGGWGLRPLHHPWTLLSLLQLVVLKQSFISRNPMSSIWKCQQACRHRHQCEQLLSQKRLLRGNRTYRIPQPARLWILLQISSHRILWRFHYLETSHARIPLRTWHEDGTNQCYFYTDTEEIFTFPDTDLDPSVKKSTPEPWKSPFSNWPL